MVWTGRELIVWGGQSGPQGDVLHADGAGYNPVTNTWRLLPAAPLSARVGQTAVWTGTEMMIWGGYDEVANGSLRVSAEGAEYNPLTNRWQLIPDSPLTARAYALSVWTGTRVLILGGVPAVVTSTAGQYPDGAQFDPRSGAWSHIDAPPPVHGHDIDWRLDLQTEGDLFAWSEWSQTRQLTSNESTTSGGVDLYGYDEDTGRWRNVPTDARALPDIEDAVWTGHDIYVRGITYNCGVCPGPFVPEATAVYNPAQDIWTRLPADPLGGDHLLSAWTGAALLSFDPSGAYGSTIPGDTSIYDPRTNTWKRASAAPFACDSLTDPVWTGHEILQYCPRPSSGGGARHDGLAFTPSPT